VSSFDDDSQLRSTKELLTKQRAELQRLRAEYDKLNRLAVGVVVDLGPLTRAIEDQNTKIASTQQKIASLEAHYPAGLKNAIVEQWIMYPSSVRCRIDLHDVGCLNNEQIDSYASKVVTK
jgi:hypothetical protein